MIKIPQPDLHQMILEEQRKTNRLLKDIKIALTPIKLEAAPMTEERKQALLEAIEGIQTKK